MSKLKNTFGIPQSVLDVVNGIYEATNTEKREKIENVSRPDAEGQGKKIGKQGEIKTKIMDEALSGKQHKLDVAEPKGKLTKADFDKLRMRKEEVELKESQAFDLNELYADISEILHSIKEAEILELDESSTDYLQTIIEQLDSLIDHAQLNEGRPKGSKNKSKVATTVSAPTSNKPSDSEEEDEGEDVHEPASRDGRHVITDLRAAADSKEGGKVQTSGGQRHVKTDLASKMHDHLMKMKPEDRAKHSAHIFRGAVSGGLKSAADIGTHRLIKQMGTTEAGKRGRGRPKKTT